MEFELTESNGHLAIAGIMNVYHASKLKDALLTAVRDRRGEAVLDLSGVSDIDTAGIQILLMLRRLAAAAGGRFVIIAASESVTEVLKLYGLAAVIDRPTTAEAGAA